MPGDAETFVVGCPACGRQYTVGSNSAGKQALAVSDDPCNAEYFTLGNGEGNFIDPVLGGFMFDT